MAKVHPMQISLSVFYLLLLSVAIYMGRVEKPTLQTISRLFGRKSVVQYGLRNHMSISYVQKRILNQLSVCYVCANLSYVGNLPMPKVWEPLFIGTINCHRYYLGIFLNVQKLSQQYISALYFLYEPYGNMPQTYFQLCLHSFTKKLIYQVITRNVPPYNVDFYTQLSSTFI